MSGQNTDLNADDASSQPALYVSSYSRRYGVSDIFSPSIFSRFSSHGEARFCDAISATVLIRRTQHTCLSRHRLAVADLQRREGQNMMHIQRIDPDPIRLELLVQFPLRADIHPAVRTQNFQQPTGQPRIDPTPGSTAPPPAGPAQTHPDAAKPAHESCCNEPSCAPTSPYDSHPARESSWPADTRNKLRRQLDPQQLRVKLRLTKLDHFNSKIFFNCVFL